MHGARGRRGHSRGYQRARVIALIATIIRHIAGLPDSAITFLNVVPRARLGPQVRCWEVSSLSTSRSQRVQYRLAIPGDNCEICASRRVGFSPALLPFLQRSRIDAKRARKLGLRHSCLGSDALHIHLIRQHNTPHRELHLALRIWARTSLAVRSSSLPNSVRPFAITLLLYGNDVDTST